jgi:hypothetical protein
MRGRWTLMVCPHVRLEAWMLMGKRRHLLSAMSIGCTVFVGSPCWAATVEPGQGDVSINRGEGFKPINSRVNANVGDLIMVGPGGAATIVYDDSCKVNVQPGAVATIAPLPPCKSGSADDYLAPTIVGALVAGVLAAGIWEATQSNSTTTPVSP